LSSPIFVIRARFSCAGILHIISLHDDTDEDMLWWQLVLTLL
jgi:hypothetical protein